MVRPFDDNLINLMVDTTKFLVHETNAIIGYTQSDEITLILYSRNRNTLIYNDGKKQKILSKLTGKCVSFFNQKRRDYFPYYNVIANFDSRIYQTPTLQDACAQLIWRENDATKNSISMLAQSVFPHKSLQNLNGNQLQDKLMLEKNINWSKLLTRYKRGTYVKRILTGLQFSSEEIENLPLHHNARNNPELIVKQHIIKEVEYPKLTSINNLKDVIFQDAMPSDVSMTDLFPERIKYT